MRAQLADVAQGKAFLLQGGDCAELFDACSQDPIEHKLSLYVVSVGLLPLSCLLSTHISHAHRILIMSLIILHGSRLPVVRIARIAGQYAKPRSKATETVDYPTPDGSTVKKEVLSFRGDNVNGFEVTDRQADPARLLSAYFHSSATLNYIRALLSSGFADLHQPRTWSFSHVHSPDLQQSFEQVIESLMDSLDFMRAATGPTQGGSRGGTETVDFFTSHEGLSLEYEQAMTRSTPVFVSPPVSAEPSPCPTPQPGISRTSSILPRPRTSTPRPASPANGEYCHQSQSTTGGQKFYNLSSHFLWIGDRTRQLDGAHVEYFRGIQNPIGIKIGPTMQPEDLVNLLNVVNPDNVPGKVTLISRYGADKVEQFLPLHIEAVKATRHVVVWQCDAMVSRGFRVCVWVVRTRLTNHDAHCDFAARKVSLHI